MRYIKARYVGNLGTRMGEVDNRMESDGKALFIIRNGQKIARFDAGEWVPLLPGIVVRNTPDGIKIDWAH
jgi:hypothetical protein